MKMLRYYFVGKDLDDLERFGDSDGAFDLNADVKADRR